MLKAFKKLFCVKRVPKEDVVLARDGVAEEEIDYWNTIRICPHCFSNRLRFKGNLNRNKEMNDDEA